MSVKADAVLAILQSRYDYYSARAVLSSAATSAGLKKTGPFDGAALAALADAIRAADDTAGKVADAVRAAAGGGPTPAAKPAPVKAAPDPTPAPAAPKAEPAKAEPAKAEPAKAEPAKAEPAKAADAATSDDDDASAKKTNPRGRGSKGKS